LVSDPDVVTVYDGEALDEDAHVVLVVSGVALHKASAWLSHRTEELAALAGRRVGFWFVIGGDFYGGWFWVVPCQG